MDYHYVSMEEFEKKIEQEGFVEHAKFGGNRYGTSKDMIRDFIGRGRVVVLDIEMEVRFALFILIFDCERSGWRGVAWVQCGIESMELI